MGGLPSERVTMTYNHYELPTLMGVAGKTFVAKVDYSPMGDVLRTHTGTAGSQLYSANFFDEQTRRITRQVNSREKAPGQINDTSYTYDAVGNILSITDKEGPEASATTDTQCFAYDYMRRMSDAWTATDGCAAEPVLVVVQLRRGREHHVPYRPGRHAEPGVEHRGPPGQGDQGW
ncbi:hypothetical protein [Streptomyces sp. NPDC051567]|uniref:hypothetical protein n=1 Tax=Streptomyces sp. NPDC051567 TaxID=3365660 RepID=UPI0037AE41A6